MRPLRQQVDEILEIARANGGTLPSWTLRHNDDTQAWTLRVDRRVVACWNERNAPGVGMALEPMLHLLARVSRVAHGGSVTVEQQVKGGAKGAAKAARENDTARKNIATIRVYLDGGGDAKGKVGAWMTRFDASRSTIYRWIEAARRRPPPIT